MIRTLSLKTWSPMLGSFRHYSYPVVFHQYLQNQPSTNYTKLENGLMIATEYRNSVNAGVGLFLDAGSRYEDYFERGLANFFEHIAYKGSCNRTRANIEELMTCTGAKFKSFTSREMVAYYADCWSLDTCPVIEILAESVFNNSASSDDIEFQKNIVLMGMDQSDKDANCLVDEYLHASAFQGTGLGNTIQGTSYNVQEFNSEVVNRFLYKNFHPCYAVLAVVGPVKHEAIVTLAKQYEILSKPRTVACRPGGYYRYTGSEARYRNDALPLCNVAIAVEGPSFWNDDSIIMELAATFVGGWDKSQPWGRDNANVLAQAASIDKLCEGFMAFNINYKETGLWGTQFLGESLNLENMCHNIQNVWMKLCTIITDNELDRAKNELKTKILSKTESTMGNCLELGRWTMYKGYKPSLHERLTFIDRVTAEDVKSVCTKYIYNQCPVVAAVGPCEGLPDYTRIEASMYWLRL